MKDESGRMQNRHNIKGEIDKLHQPGPNPDWDHEPGEFYIDPQKGQKRNKEMPEDDDHSNGPPRTAFANFIPKRLLRHVGIPDDEILRKMDISVEHSESQKERP